MAVFDRLSRYVKPPLELYEVTDIRGRKVKALPVPDAPNEVPVGRHVLESNQRLDQLAAAYLKDANGYWRLAEVNEAILPDAALQLEQLKVPAPNR